jgi:hypothetical protein
VRFKVLRSNKDRRIHLLCAEGSEAFEALPAAIRNLGPWAGSREGEVSRLRLPLRSLLIDHYAHVSKLDIEIPSGPPTHRHLEAAPSRDLCRCALAAACPQRAERRSMSLKRPQRPHRIIHGASAVGARYAGSALK